MSFSDYSNQFFVYHQVLLFRSVKAINLKQQIWMRKYRNPTNNDTTVETVIIVSTGREGGEGAKEERERKEWESGDYRDTKYSSLRSTTLPLNTGG